MVGPAGGGPLGHVLVDAYVEAGGEGAAFSGQDYDSDGFVRCDSIKGGDQFLHYFVGQRVELVRTRDGQRGDGLRCVAVNEGGRAHGCGLGMTQVVAGFSAAPPALMSSSGWIPSPSGLG